MIEVLQATDADREVVARLAQLYQYDFTEFDDGDVSGDGLFDGIDVDPYFDTDDRFAYLLRVSGEIAGFAFVSDSWSVLEQGDHYLAEFFVMRRFRGQGTGARFAAEVFDRHAGTWEVAQIRRNVPAQGFWRKVIGAYTGGKFVEHDIDNDRWDGVIQVFTS